MMQRKKFKQNHEDYIEPVTKNYLCVLPPEILDKIFQCLSPPDLVAIEELGVPRLTDATALKKADFRDCYTVKEELINGYFKPFRNSCLKEIYLHHMLYLDGKAILKCVSKCKFLTKLNVSASGILSYTDILNLLEKCKNLKELHWCVSALNSFKFLQNGTKHNLERIYLTLTSSYVPSLNVLCWDLISRCETQSKVFLNFTYFTVFLSVEFNVANILNVSKSIYTITEEYSNNNNSMDFVKTFFEIFAFEDDDAKSSLTAEGYQGFYVSHSEIYPIYTGDRSFKSSPIHTLVLIDNLKDTIVDQEFLTHLKKCSRRSLKHLSVLNKTIEVENVLESQAELLRFQIALNALLDVFVECSNLQEIEFLNIHFDTNCLEALHGLKQLKILKLPPCAFAKEGVGPIEAGSLEALVSNCKNVESFSLHNCFHVKCKGDILEDDDLVPIHKWSNLKNLSFARIRHLRTCNFLYHIANHTSLTTLCLTEIGHEGVCHFNASLIYIIGKSHLKFLKINQKSYHPYQPLFWKRICDAKTLEGLCIFSFKDTHIPNQPIRMAVEQLPRLRLFHLQAKRASECLKDQIRRVMKGHGIQHPEVQIVGQNYTQLLPVCKMCHYPFIVPTHFKHL